MSAVTAPPAVSECFHGPIDGNRPIEDLRSIAGALSLSTLGNRATIAKRIKEHINDKNTQVELQTNPRFQSLFFYKNEGSKSERRTSAHKDAESAAAMAAEDHNPFLHATTITSLLTYPTVKVNVRMSEDIKSEVTEYWVESGITENAQVPFYGDSSSGMIAVPLNGIVKNVIEQFDTPRKRTCIAFLRRLLM
jgi:hypothetical protein